MRNWLFSYCLQRCSCFNRAVLNGCCCEGTSLTNPLLCLDFRCYKLSRPELDSFASTTPPRRQSCCRALAMTSRCLSQRPCWDLSSDFSELPQIRLHFWVLSSKHFFRLLLGNVLVKHSQYLESMASELVVDYVTILTCPNPWHFFVGQAHKSTDFLALRNDCWRCCSVKQRYSSAIYYWSDKQWSDSLN